MTTLYRHILIASDLSENSDAIAKRATIIAQFSKAEISIVHVLAHAPIPYAGEFSIPIDLEMENTIRKQAKMQLAELSSRYHISDNAQYLEQGSVKLAVTDLANKINVDLIVVGTHSHKGIELLLGSQANAILHAAKCDVLVVRIQ